LAQAKTLSVLEALDSEHKKSIVQFLYNAQLLRIDAPVVSLRGANLRGTDLRGADLSDANLPEAVLRGADLSDANLSNADLSDARGITSEELEKQAKSLEGTTMPDKTEHD